QITKLSNWKEANDPADISAFLSVLGKLQKFDDLKTRCFESATDEKMNGIQISLAELDSDMQELEIKFKTLYHNCQIKNSNDSIH
ncbi:hypothetical protein NPIL_128931, partial [Nephila pilipes]